MASAGSKGDAVEDLPEKYFFVRGHSRYDVRAEVVDVPGVRFLPLVDLGYICTSTIQPSEFFELLIDIVRDKDPATIKDRITLLRSLSRSSEASGDFTPTTLVNATKNVTYDFFHKDKTTTQIGIYDLDVLATFPVKDAIHSLVYGSGVIPAETMTLYDIISYLHEIYSHTNLVLVLGGCRLADVGLTDSQKEDIAVDEMREVFDGTTIGEGLARPRSNASSRSGSVVRSDSHDIASVYEAPDGPVQMQDSPSQEGIIRPDPISSQSPSDMGSSDSDSDSRSSQSPPVQRMEHTDSNSDNYLIHLRKQAKARSLAKALSVNQRKPGSGAGKKPQPPQSKKKKGGKKKTHKVRRTRKKGKRQSRKKNVKHRKTRKKN